MPPPTLDDLPDLALRRVLALLDGTSLARLACCSRALRALSRDDALWAALVRRRFGARHLLPRPPCRRASSLRRGDLLAPVLHEADSSPGEGGWAFFPGLEPAFSERRDGDDGDGGGGNVPLLPILRAAEEEEDKSKEQKAGGHDSSRRRHRRHPVLLTPLLVRRALEEAAARGYPAVTLDVRDEGGSSEEEEEEEGGDDNDGSDDEGDAEEDENDALSFRPGGRDPERPASAAAAAAGPSSSSAPQQQNQQQPPPPPPAPPRVTSAHLVPASAFRAPGALAMRRLSYHPLSGTFVRRDACADLRLRALPSDEVFNGEEDGDGSLDPSTGEVLLPWPPSASMEAAAAAASAPRFTSPSLDNPRARAPQERGGANLTWWVWFPGWRLPAVASTWPRELQGASRVYRTLPTLLSDLSAQHRRALSGAGGSSALAQVPQAVQAPEGRYHGFQPAPPPTGATAEDAALRRGTPLPPQAAWRPSPRWSEGVFVRADVAAARGFLQRPQWEARAAAAAAAAGAGEAAPWPEPEEEPAAAAASSPGSSSPPPPNSSLPPPPHHRAVYARLSRLVHPVARAATCAWLDGGHLTVASRADAAERWPLWTGGGGGGRAGEGSSAAPPVHPFSAITHAVGRLLSGRLDDGQGVPEAAGPVLRVLHVCWLDVRVRIPGVPLPLRTNGAGVSGGARTWEVVWRVDLSAALVESPLTFSARVVLPRRRRRRRRRGGVSDSSSSSSILSVARVVAPAELRAMAAATARALSSSGGRGTRWTEVVVGPLRPPDATDEAGGGLGSYASVEARCHAHDGSWKRALDFDCVYVRLSSSSSSSSTEQEGG